MSAVQVTRTRRRAVVPAVVNHWLRKADITRSLVEGVEVVALCGERLQVAVNGGRVDAGGGTAVVCPLCAAVRADIAEEG